MRATKDTINPKLKDHLRVRKGVNGFGLFTDVDIKKGEYIIEYVGDLISAKAADKKGGQYLFEINSRWTIDGTPRSNTARYINHSCRPNCESDTREREKRVLIFSRKNIKAGEELNYDYGKVFWDDWIKPKGCRCAKCQEAKK